jgi:hypothetical protein
MKGDDAIGEFQATKETRDVFEWAARLLETTRQKGKEKKPFEKFIIKCSWGFLFLCVTRQGAAAQQTTGSIFVKDFKSISFSSFLYSKKEEDRR